MNVLLLTDGIYPFVIGGMQKHSYNLAKHLTLSGINLTLVHCVPNGAELISHQEVSVALFGKESLQSKFSTLCFEFPKLRKFYGHYLFESYLYSKRIIKSGKVNLDEFDIIYIQGFSGWYLLKKVKGIRKKSIVNFHGMEMFQKPTDFREHLIARLLRPFVKINIRRSGYAQSLGGKLTSIISSCGIDKSKIIQIPIGIEKSWIRTKEIGNNSPRKLIFIGRNERRKGFTELLQAYKQSKAKGLNIELHIIGPFESSSDFSGLIFHGKINEEIKIRQIITSCDLLICPSYSEGMPTVILEAMACGCAVIASDVGAVSVEVDNTNGWLIQPGDIANLVEKIQLAVSTDETTLTSMKKKSITKIEQNFLWENVIKLTIDHFNRIKQTNH